MLSHHLNPSKSYIPWRGADSRNKAGPDSSNLKGPSKLNISNSNGKAKGPDSNNRKGPSGFSVKKPVHK